MTDTLIVNKAAEVPASPAAHMRRTAVLLAVLERLDDSDLPEIARWSSESRDYAIEESAPSLVGEFRSVFQLDKARAAVQAWATALGTTMTEQYVEDYSRAIVLQAAVVIDGVWIRVGTRLGVHDTCRGCGGPAIGDTVLRHFTDAPCASSLALQA